MILDHNVLIYSPELYSVDIYSIISIGYIAEYHEGRNEKITKLL